MNKSALAITLSSVMLVGSVSAAARSSKEENVGVGAGAVIGAIVGGPIGFIIGASAGALLGDKMNKQKVTTATGKEALAQAQRQLQSLRGELALAENRFNVLKNKPPLVVKTNLNLQFDLLFHTGQSTLQPLAKRRVAELARHLKDNPDMQIRLDGFADMRGQHPYNQTLSEQRLSVVQAALVSSGIDVSRIQSFPHGERSTLALEGDIDGYATDRRVSIQITVEPVLSSYAQAQ